MIPAIFALGWILVSLAAAVLVVRAMISERRK